MDDKSREEWLQQLESSRTPSQGASGKAIASLILGILGLVGCGGPIAGIVALVLGYGELKAIDAGKSSAAGRGFARAGLIMGWISVGLSILAVLIYLIYFLFLSGILGR